MRGYHSTCKLSDLLQAQEKEAKGRPETTSEQLTKLADKCKKASSEIEVTRSKYQESLRDITNYNPKYIEDMNYEFNKCQDVEKIRRDFMKEKLQEFHGCLDRQIFSNRLVAPNRQCYCVFISSDVIDKFQTNIKLLRF